MKKGSTRKKKPRIPRIDFGQVGCGVDVEKAAPPKLGPRIPSVGLGIIPKPKQAIENDVEIQGAVANSMTNANVAHPLVPSLSIAEDYSDDELEAQRAFA